MSDDVLADILYRLTRLENFLGIKNDERSAENATDSQD